MTSRHDPLRLGEGATLARTCPECSCTTTILTPEKNGHGNDQNRWEQWRNLVRAQIAWPLLCDACKAWWNDRIDATRQK